MTVSYVKSTRVNACARAFTSVRLYCVKGLTKSSASKYTDFPVFLRKSHSIYGKETEHKSAQEGIIQVEKSFLQNERGI